jgi:hypothetical protein
MYEALAPAQLAPVERERRRRAQNEQLVGVRRIPKAKMLGCRQKSISHLEL